MVAWSVRAPFAAASTMASPSPASPFGYTPDTMRIWWLPATKEKFSYEDGCFYPYDGPVIHGTGYTF